VAKPVMFLKSCLCVMLVTLGAVKEARSQMAHHIESFKIDGAQYPDQIPDKLAWSLYFGAVSEPPNANPSEIARQKAKLKTAHLSDVDLAQAARVLADFHVKSKDIDTRLAEDVLAFESTGTAIDYKAFIAEKETLIDNTHATLQQVLAAAGMANLEAHIRHEKQFMTAFIDANNGGQTK
jgi:hypothetical protein